MKKRNILISALMLSLCLCACGRKNNDSTVPETTPGVVTPMPSVPMIDPTLDTNIPDPNVDSNSTEDGSLTDDMTTPHENARRRHRANG